MKPIRFLFTLICLCLAVSGFAQRGLQNFTDHKSGDAISYNRDNIVRAYPSEVGTKLWFNAGSPTDVDDVFANVLADNSGGLVQFMYVPKAGQLKFIALNPDYIVKMYPFNSAAQAVAIMKDGKQFLLDTSFTTAISMLSTSGALLQTVTEFTNATDTFYYSIPAGAKTLSILGIGAGGGGGSGRRGAAGAFRGGGSGGGSGAVSWSVIDVSDIANDSLDIIVGLAGTAGAAVTANTTSGNDGVDGGSTKIFVTGTSIQLLVASGGSKGLGGSTAAVAGGAGGTIGDWAGKAGGNGDTTGVAASASTTKVGGGGGGGGGVGVTDVNRAGGNGAAGWYSLSAAGTGGAGGAQGTASTAITAPALTGGGGSGAGGGGFAGRPGLQGAGGGGGSASANGTDSGAGGAGGGGYIRIIANF